jgi:hypothetical protein
MHQTLDVTGITAAGRHAIDEGPAANAQKEKTAGLVTLFLDSGRFTDPIAQVIQLRPANITNCHALYFSQRRRMQREGSFNSHAEAEFTNSKRFSNPRASPSYHIALKKLRSFAVTFDYSDMNLTVSPGLNSGWSFLSWA